MGWMHDTLEYFSQDAIYRKYHQDKLTFSIWYAFSENFALPLSHDEVVHGKGSLYGKMPGDPWQKRANLRLLFGYMYTHPGKKLLFMGDEFGQHREWSHLHSLDWHLTEEESHQGLQKWVRDLNHLYRSEPALFETDFHRDGFAWIDFHADSSAATSREASAPTPADSCSMNPLSASRCRVPGKFIHWFGGQGKGLRPRKTWSPRDPSYCG